LYGQFVQAAYTMYDADPSNLTPSPSSDFPEGYKLIAWLQMQDFILQSSGLVFYGFVAQNEANANRYVLAIRGTSNGVEWWDDANAISMTQFKVPNCGSVGAGFARIYDTLEVVARPVRTGAVSAAPRSLKSLGRFSKQVSALVNRHAAAKSRAVGFGGSAAIEITGHSLGAALATLYTLENARTEQISTPAVCTFASPLVGDATFAAAFNGLGLLSWRIVNAPDLVPMLPPGFLGFRHVDTLQQFNSSGSVSPSLSCWHALATYLSMIDPQLQPGADCRLKVEVSAPALIAGALRAGGSSVSIPAGPVTLNITINT
jgi:Lipase (class 3)